MSSLKGYRTIIFNLIMGAASMAGLTLDPAHALAWAGTVVTVWTVGGVLLRIVTDSPVLRADFPTLAAVAAELEPLTPSSPVISRTLKIPAAPVAQATDPKDWRPAPPDDLVGLAHFVTDALHTVQSIHDDLVPKLQDAAAKVAVAMPAKTVEVAPTVDPNPAPAAAAAQTGAAPNA